jgi:hypothetical protein
MSGVKMSPTKTWAIANQEYLMAAIARVRSYLQRHIQRLNPEAEFDTAEFFSLKEQARGWDLQTPPSLDELGDRFGLSAFERDLLLLCAGMELDGTWGNLCATAQGDAQAQYPTFTLALDVLPSPNWMALTPVGALRRWRLIEIGVGNALTQSPLRIDERVLHYLVGIEHPDERLVAAVSRIPIQVGEMDRLCGSHRQLAEQVAGMLVSEELGKVPIVQLCGSDVASKRAIASAVCSAIGWNLHVMAGDVIPIALGEITELMRLWEREAFLNNSALLLDCDEVDSNDVARESAIARIIENYDNPLLITSRDRRHPRQRPLITFEVEQPSSQEQRELWINTLGPTAASLNGHIETLVSNFSLSAPAIRAACLKTKGTNKIATDNGNDFGSQLWETCRIQARSRMEDLAQRIESGSQWEDLVLPDIQRDTLREIIAHVRQRAKVYETWGFGGKSGRGLGITALFAGASGTGKTMAADIIAQELHLDLYRIDLSSIISKYIGETEKNLRRVFDSAEAGGSILLFDEADALFGKRSEVKDSHDRHANIEVAYLLQRMEAYRGLAILTTNLKSSLDQAFLRRIRFVIQFPFPDANQREEIWRRIFPKQTPTQGLNYPKLGKLNVAGGNIRNIALNSAFIAADANEPVMMKHILEASKSEYMKLERPLTDMEIKGWI